MDQRSAPPSAVIRSWLRQLQSDGFRDVRTGAIHAEQHAPFMALGFEAAQELALLHRPMPRERRSWIHRSTSVRRARPSEFGRLSALDAAAFPAGWALDVTAITDAATATPRHRIAVIDGAGGQPLAYAVSGRAGQAAFLQRLAVDPSAQHQGLGRRLVADCIGWAARWGVQTVAVNTQHDNVNALSLYQSMGFIRRPNGLTVMQRTLDGNW
jgi:GNAT superfamily N-acetyltransferase